MIRRVTLRRFKRFDEVRFDLPGHVVLSGPNNTGKTTVLQAIAAWSLAFDRWTRLNDFQRHGGAYSKAPIARQTFSAVPLRAFDPAGPARFVPEVSVLLAGESLPLRALRSPAYPPRPASFLSAFPLRPPPVSRSAA